MTTRRYRPLAWLTTFLFVLLAWVPFRCPQLEQTGQTYQRLFAFFDRSGQQLESAWFAPCLVLLLLGQGLSVWLENSERNPSWLSWFGLEICRLPLAGPYLCLVRANFFSGWLLTIWLGSVFLFASTSYEPFIYFRF